MARCNQCNSVITRSDVECFVCNEPVPGAKKPFWRRKNEPKAPSQATPVTPLSNLLFVASLGLTLFSFIAPHAMSVAAGSTVGGLLFVARIASDRVAARRQLALRPVTVTRLHY
jgi:hypothetical protein